MHEQSKKEALKFKEKYISDLYPLRVLDIGSQDINGSLRSLFEPYHEYLGLDITKGKNVDIVANNLLKLPLRQKFDVVVTSSCFEHNPLFWVTFNEMVRVTKKGGLIYINTPSEGPYHGYPVDCWRFLEDAYRALETWNPKVKLIESYICSNDPWHDNIGIFERIK